MSVLKIVSFQDISVFNYLYKLTNSISFKLTIISTALLWESCSFQYSEQLSHSNAVLIIVSLKDIELVSLKK